MQSREFCPVCEKKGQRSIVVEGPIKNNFIEVRPIIREDGRERLVSAPNQPKTQWRCSMGHSFWTYWETPIGGKK